MAAHARSDIRVIGRYALYDEIASGGMATVHLGRLLGEAGFSRTVAIKRLHAQFAKDPDFVAMFIDEARLAARIHHPNVVSTLDVVARDRELFLVMEYVPGEALSRLFRAVASRGEPIDPRISTAIVVDSCTACMRRTRHATSGASRSISFNRDVSPQNVLVGVDGIPRVVDFGVAKAAGRLQTTREGQLKGKLPYMAPEQIQGVEATRRSDIFAAAIILWELLTGQRLFDRGTEAAVMMAVLTAEPPPPSSVAPSRGISPALDRITLRALARSPAARYATAREMALDLETAIDLALPSEIGAWVSANAGNMLDSRATRVAEVESKSGIDVYPRSDAPVVEPESRTALTAAAPDRRAATGAWEDANPARGGDHPRVPGDLLRGRTSPRRVERGDGDDDSIGDLGAPRRRSRSVHPCAGRSACKPAVGRLVDRAVVPRRGSSSPRGHRPRETSAARSEQMQPPFRLDAAGRKIFKIECL